MLPNMTVQFRNLISLYFYLCINFLKKKAKTCMFVFTINLAETYFYPFCFYNTKRFMLLELLSQFIILYCKLYRKVCLLLMRTLAKNLLFK